MSLFVPCSFFLTLLPGINCLFKVNVLLPCHFDIQDTWDSLLVFVPFVEDAIQNVYIDSGINDCILKLEHFIIGSVISGCYSHSFGCSYCTLFSIVWHELWYVRIMKCVVCECLCECSEIAFIHKRVYDLKSRATLLLREWRVDPWNEFPHLYLFFRIVHCYVLK